MNYTIISINEDRKLNKKAIRNNVDLPYLPVTCFNAHTDDPALELKRRGLTLHGEPDWIPKKGEIGIWLSCLNAWQACVDSGEPLMVFEDDAFVPSSFMKNFADLATDLPEDYGYMALWVPQNQYQDYMYKLTWDERGFPNFLGYRARSQFNIGSKKICKVYQGYGGVAILYSPEGAQALIDCTKEFGMFNPSDCFIYLMAHAGRVDGYAPLPGLEPVEYHWNTKTTIHDTERVL